MDKGRGHLAPVAKLERPLAQPAAGDKADGVGGAAVDLDEGDELFPVRAAWVVDFEAAAGEQRHADA